MSPRTPVALVALGVVAGCGSQDNKASEAASVPVSVPSQAQKAPPLPQSCATNADGVIRTIDLDADTGFIVAGKLGSRIRFRPNTDVVRGTVKQGSPVFFTYKKTAAGGRATCVLAQR